MLKFKEKQQKMSKQANPREKKINILLQIIKFQKISHHYHVVFRNKLYIILIIILEAYIFLLTNE